MMVVVYSECPQLHGGSSWPQGRWRSDGDDDVQRLRVATSPGHVVSWITSPGSPHWWTFHRADRRQPPDHGNSDHRIVVLFLVPLDIVSPMILFFQAFISYTGGQSVSHVLLWQPFECDSMLFSENKYDDDDVVCRASFLEAVHTTLSIRVGRRWVRPSVGFRLDFRKWTHIQHQITLGFLVFIFFCS